MGLAAMVGCCLGSSENQQVRGKAQKAAAAVPREGGDGDRLRGQRGPRRTVSTRLTAPGEGWLALTLLGLASPVCPCSCGLPLVSVPALLRPLRERGVWAVQEGQAHELAEEQAYWYALSVQAQPLGEQALEARVPHCPGTGHLQSMVSFGSAF